MFLLGLTGSIGMGKSTVADMFLKHEVPVFDADKAVHQLYRAGGLAVAPVEAAFPGTTDAAGVRRDKLGPLVIGNKAAMTMLEGIVHPLVVHKRESFLRDMARDYKPLVVLDIPLLYETRAQGEVDAVAVVSCSPTVQRQRVLSRPDMHAEKYEAILARQVPDAQKRRQADYIIDTGLSLSETEAFVVGLIQELSKRQGSKADPVVHATELGAADKRHSNM